MTARFLTALLLCVLAGSAHAHTLSVAHLDVVLADDGSAVLELDAALRDLALTFPIDADRDERITWAELLTQREAIGQWAVAGIVVSSAAGVPCTLSPSGFGTRHYDDGGYASLQLSARCDGGAAARLRYALLLDRDPQHRAIVTIHQGDASNSAIASAGREQVSLAARVGNPFVDYLREGIHHILIGYDHLAFLVSLLLPAALVRMRRQWFPAQSLRASFGHVLGIVTAFTLAHSITLSLAALGWITPASRPVEALIAASVLLAALNNIWPLVTSRIWMVGFAFGLIHGFGFAGALSELGLPVHARLLALLGFNLGVEVGQLLVVALLLPLLYAVRRWPGYPRVVMPLLSTAIACLAGWWLVQRLAS